MTPFQKIHGQQNLIIHLEKKQITSLKIMVYNGEKKKKLNYLQSKNLKSQLNNLKINQQQVRTKFPTY